MTTCEITKFLFEPINTDIVQILGITYCVGCLHKVILYSSKYAFTDITYWCTQNNANMIACEYGKTIFGPISQKFPFGTSIYQIFTTFYFLHIEEAAMFKLQFYDSIYE